MSQLLPLYQRIAQLVEARRSCEQSRNMYWEAKHAEKLREIAARLLPSGSGFDHGSSILEESTGDRLVLSTSFHHMDESGYYDGWSEHDIIVTPSLAFGFILRVTGRERRGGDLKAHIADTFREAISTMYEDDLAPRV